MGSHDSQSVIFLVLLCAGLAASQADCTTELGQGFWIIGNVENGTLSCALPLQQLNDTGSALTKANVQNVELICTDTCAEPFLAFLEGTERCRNDPVAATSAYGLRNVICSFSESVDEPGSSCTFANAGDRLNDSRVEQLLEACAAWWLVPDTTGCQPGCASALQSSVDLIGCCYNNLFNNSLAVRDLTERVRDYLNFMNMTVPENLTVDITDPDLLKTCSVNLPDPAFCPAQFREGSGQPLIGSLLLSVLSVGLTFLALQ